MDDNRTFAKHNQIIYEHLKNKTPLTDSLRYYYSWLLGHGNFQPMTVAYENLKSQGINIVKNENLRKEISKLYDFTYIAEEKTHIPSLAHIHQLFVEQVNEHLVTETSYQSAQPVDLKALQNDIQFQETLKSIVFARKWSNMVLNDAKENIVKLKSSIEEELKVLSK